MSTETNSLQAGDSRLLRRLYVFGLVLAAVLRIVLIDRHGLWNNELITYQVLGLSYSGIVSERLAVNHMPLYFLMLKAWTTLFGVSEPSMRAIGAIFGWLAVWAAGRLARRLGGLRLAVPVVLGAAVHQMWLSTALEARMYSVLTWAAIESTDAYFAWARAELRQGGRGCVVHLLRWTLVTVFGFYIHMLYAIVFTFQILDALIRKLTQRLPLRRFAAAWGATLLLCVPISIAWFEHQSKIGDEKHLDFKSAGIVVRQTIRVLWGDYSSLDDPFSRVAAYVLFALALIGVIALMRGGRQIFSTDARENADSLRDFRALGVSYLLFLLGLYGASAVSSSSMLGEERYFAAFFPVCLILGAGGMLYLIRWNFRAGMLALAGALILQAAYSAGYYASPGEGFREGVQAVEKDMPPGRGLVTVLSGGAETTLGRYYGRDLKVRPLKLDRYEKREFIVDYQLEQYTEKYPEFWVLAYHEKRDTLWNVLNDPASGYAALTEPREIGKAKIQLFVRHHPGRSDESGTAAPSVSGESATTTTAESVVNPI